MLDICSLSIIRIGSVAQGLRHGQEDWRVVCSTPLRCHFLFHFYSTSLKKSVWAFSAIFFEN